MLILYSFSQVRTYSLSLVRLQPAAVFENAVLENNGLRFIVIIPPPR